MKDANYLIVGGGMTAAAAVKGIRDVDQTGSIHIVSSDVDPPYQRPPLSKGLWHDEPVDKIWIDLDKFSARLQLGRTITWLNLQTNTAVDDQGDSYHFDKLLIAAGGRPRRLPNGGEKAIHYRSFHDYQRLRELTDRVDRFVIVGGGFIGSELAASLAGAGKKVTMVINNAGIGARVFPEALVSFLNDYYRERGIELRVNEKFMSREETPDGITVHTRSNETHENFALATDGIIAGIGIEPNTDLALSAGINVDDGIVVNEFLQTSCPDVYAAGDVASFWQPQLGVRRRVEHEDNALKMGRHAGRVMAGKIEPYHHLPFFYSDLFDLGYEAVGEIDAKLDTVVDWKDPYREGIVYYHRDGVIRGVLMWNVWNQVKAARALIADHARIDGERLGAGVESGALVSS